MNLGILLAILATASPAVAEPTQLVVRATGLFADYELELLRPEDGYNPGPGLNFTLGGLEISTALPGGLAIEAGGEALVGLAGAGWAGVVRGGWRYHLHGQPPIERNRWFGALTPLAGLRVGRIPWSSTSDGYNIGTLSVGPQAGIAYDAGRAGPRVGYAARLFAAVNYRALNQKVPASGNGWSYAAGEPARVSFELGLSFGVTLPVL